jgi:hypothetical protein
VDEVDVEIFVAIFLEFSSLNLFRLDRLLVNSKLTEKLGKNFFFIDLWLRFVFFLWLFSFFLLFSLDLDFLCNVISWLRLFAHFSEFGNITASFHLKVEGN